jgi:lipopolysaccharide transport system permease protein
MRLVPAIDLLRQLVYRELYDRYRGSVLGIAWALVLPLSMLAIYTFVFGFVFRARWPGAGDDPFAFSLFLYCGLLPYLFLVDTLARAPTLMRQYGALVKRVAFPLPLLGAAMTIAATLHMFIGFGVLALLAWAVHGHVELTALWALPLALPLLLAALGLVWIIASSGVYFRDLAQAVPAVLPAILFLSPVFYPVTAVPAAFRDWMLLNPLTTVIDNLRSVVIAGATPDLSYLAVGCLLGGGLALVGLLWFARLRPGFADVL